MVETVIAKENGKVERHVWVGGGQPAEITEFDSAEMLTQERVHERRAERREKFMRPFTFVRDKVLGALDTSLETRAEQLSTETGNAESSFMHDTIDAWRDEHGEDHA